MNNQTQKGLVMRSTGSWYEIQAEGARQLWQGRLRGKFKLQGLKVTNPIAVGDLVEFEIEDETANTVTITAILPRRNYIVRQSVHKTGHAHLLAANLDQAVLIVSLKFPRTSLGFIDRFLVTAEAFRIPAVLVFNKQDLLNPEWKELQSELTALYEGLNYRCLLTTGTGREGLEPFRELLQGKKSLLSGHSGVGKSTLLNALYPELSLKTQEVSTYANKGVHTTTFAEMFECEPGTYIIDSPGIKELGLADMAPPEISHYFPEMRELLNTCRFHNCLHAGEPGCGIKQAVSDGIIAFSRYESYLSMLGNQDNRK